MLWVAAALTLLTGWDYLTAGLRHTGAGVTSRADPVPPAE
jgi:cardiolipin synthase